MLKVRLFISTICCYCIYSLFVHIMLGYEIISWFRITIFAVALLLFYILTRKNKINTK